MSNKEIILNYIKKNNSKICDDCLSYLLQISPRQQVNQICNKLYKSNEINRKIDCCSNCKKDKLVNI